MRSEQIAQLLASKGFPESLVYLPSQETRGRYLVKAKSARGWKYLRLPGDTPDPLTAVTTWVEKFEAPE